jgi:hypothetical protein
MFVYLAGCAARHSGFKSSFRQIEPCPRMHRRIGDLLCSADIVSVRCDISTSPFARSV